METQAYGRSKAGTIVLWAGTGILALLLGTAGLTKFLLPSHWQLLFAGWGYPSWCYRVVGVAELGGAVALLVPRLAFYAAMLLATVMVGALVTLLTHPGGPLGWGATPTVYVVLLMALAVARRRDRIG